MQLRPDPSVAGQASGFAFARLPRGPAPLRRRPARRARFAQDTILPILVGALAGSSAGLLIWGVAAVRFGLPGLAWP